LAAWAKVPPEKLAAAAFLPELVQAEEEDIVKALLFPELSAAVVPEPSSKLYEATGTSRVGKATVTVALVLAVVLPPVQDRLKVVVLFRLPLS
jgi:hypothetical protein